MANVNNLFPTKKSSQLLLLLCFALLPYANTLFNGFVLDDKVVFTENQFVQNGIKGIPDIFSHNSFEGYFSGSGKSSSVSEYRYRPLSLVFFAIQSQLVGNNPFIAHLLHLVLFALLCWVLWDLLNRLLGYQISAQAEMLAFISMLIFAVQPIHTEVVANVKSADEIFAFLFAGLTFRSLLLYQDGGKIIHFIWAFICFLAALFSKENAISFMVLIPLGIWMFVPKSKRNLGKSLIPILVATGIYFLCRFSAVGTQLYSESKNFLENPFLVLKGERIMAMSTGDRLGTIFYTLLRYIYLHIIPYPLTHDYAPKSISTFSIASPAALFSIVIYLAGFIFALHWVRSKPVLSFGILFFMVALAPASNLWFNTGAYMGERFAFIPSFGLCLIMAWLLTIILLERYRFGSYFICGILLIYSFRSFWRNFDWKDNLTLFQSDIQHSSNSAKLNSSLGFTLLETYRNEADKETNKHLLTQAIQHLKTAVKIYPRYTDCIYLLGNAYYLDKNYTQAVLTYEKYIDLNPADASILKNYQKALRELGRKYFYEDSNNSAAKNVLLKSYKLNNEDDQVLELLGSVEAEMGYLLKSLEYLLRSTDINPNNASTWANLYITYTRLGDKVRAQDAINRGMAIDADIVKKLMSVRTK